MISTTSPNKRNMTAVTNEPIVKAAALVGESGSFVGTTVTSTLN
jgi:hypothetical protein